MSEDRICTPLLIGNEIMLPVGRKAYVREMMLRKMKPMKRSSVHPSLGRRGIVVPYDIPKVEPCKTCGR